MRLRIKFFNNKENSLLREALFPSGSEEKLMSFSCFVKKIIDFCEEDMEAWTRLLSTDSLSLGF